MIHWLVDLFFFLYFLCPRRSLHFSEDFLSFSVTLHIYCTIMSHYTSTVPSCHITLLLYKVQRLSLSQRSATFLDRPNRNMGRFRGLQCVQCRRRDRKAAKKCRGKFSNFWPSQCISLNEFFFLISAFIFVVDNRRQSLRCLSIYFHSWQTKTVVEVAVRFSLLANEDSRSGACPYLFTNLTNEDSRSGVCPYLFS